MAQKIFIYPLNSFLSLHVFLSIVFLVPLLHLNAQQEICMFFLDPNELFKAFLLHFIYEIFTLTIKRLNILFMLISYCFLLQFKAIMLIYQQLENNFSILGYMFSFLPYYFFPLTNFHSISNFSFYFSLYLSKP